MNFCPACGTPRTGGKFCSGCGLELIPPTLVRAESISQPIEEGWYPDESNTNLEKYWHGSGWGDETRYSPSYQNLRDSLVSALEYGEGFAEATNCYNCGEPTGRRAKTCGLCEAQVR